VEPPSPTSRRATPPPPPPLLAERPAFREHVMIPYEDLHVID